jgi:hypothetical protein
MPAKAGIQYALASRRSTIPQQGAACVLQAHRARLARTKSPRPSLNPLYELLLKPDRRSSNGTAAELLVFGSEQAAPDNNFRKDGDFFGLGERGRKNNASRVTAQQHAT